MNPDPGWALFLFQHGWGGFFGAVVGAVMMWPVPHHGPDTVVVKTYENLLGMTHAGFPSGAPWEWVLIGGLVGAAIGVALWEWGRSFFVAHPVLPTPTS